MRESETIQAKRKRVDPEDSYQGTREAAVREQLVLEHLPKVHLIARRIHNRLSTNVSFDDLLSAGIVGLIRAVDRFVPTTHIRFGAYAEYSIRNAILDNLRGLSSAPRGCLPEVQRYKGNLEQELHESYYDWMVSLPTEQLSTGPNKPRQQSASQKAKQRVMVESENDSRPPIAGLTELRTFLAQAISSLPQSDQEILALYYVSQLTVREISTVLGIHPSQTSRMLAATREKLQSLLDDGAQNPISDFDLLANERADLLAQKYESGLTKKGTRRLLEIENLLEIEELRRADLIDQNSDGRITKINAGLDRVERAIGELRRLNAR